MSEHKSYFENNELEILNQNSKLSRDTPFAIQNVSQGYFSIARHYGGAVYNGSSYTYFPPGDELIRDDVFKLIGKNRRANKKERKVDRIAPATAASPSTEVQE